MDKPTVIFDLGGVLLNIDYSKSIQAFQSLGKGDFDLTYSQASQSTLFDEYEIGTISSQRFVNGLLDMYEEQKPSPNQLVSAWNAMIGNPIPENMALVMELAERCNLVLLSNTNDLHLQQVRRKFQEQSVPSLESVFQSQCFYSHEIHRRKPFAETFKWVMTTVGSNPSATWFIEDSDQHIQGAKSCGIQTLHLPSNSIINKGLLLAELGL